MKKFAIGFLALLVAGSALAQSYPPPQAPTIGTTDLIQVLPSGNTAIGNIYATPAQVAGVPGYVKNVPLTAFSLTFGNSQTYLILNPAGTLATGTVTTAANPSDGQRECIFSTQTITALTLTANTGQTINNGVTTLSANTSACYTFSKANATWDRS